MTPFDANDDAEIAGDSLADVNEIALERLDDLAGLEASDLATTVAAIREPTETPGVPDPGVAAIRDELAGLKRLFEQKIFRDQGLQGIISKLHESLQDAQADLALKFLRPVLLELIGLRDELAVGAAGPGPAATALDQFRQDVDDLLYRQGVEPFTCPGERVDPALQRVKRTRPADQPDEAGRVVERLRPGFRYGEKVVLRPEEVVALAKPAANPT
jgi:molecular chaperone GrpE (heat shock protein)